MPRLPSYLHISKKEFFLSSIALLLLIVTVPIVTYIYFAKSLSSRDTIMNRNETGITLLDRNGEPFFTFYDARYKNFVAMQDLPPYVPHAVIASEDKDFYNHPGFSLSSIVRAFFYNAINQGHLYGGSTITQQLVKNTLLNANKTYLRKAQEIVLAQEIERRYTKKEILEMYINFVYFGENAFGIENASLAYFGKSAKELTPAEAAFITALLPSPSRLSPFSGDIKEAMHRQKIILEKMYNQQYLTGQEFNDAKQQKLVFHPTKQPINVLAPHFALMVRDELIKHYGEHKLAHSGFQVRTTLDRDLQIQAEKIVQKQVENLHENHVSNGAAVVIDPKTGDILALVGSADWYDTRNGKMNLATTPRSVGSAFKPIVYATAFENDLITPATMLRDELTTYSGNYTPQDYDRSYRGPVTARRALANSLNIPAVEVMQKVGLQKTLTTAKRMGITTLTDSSKYGLSLVLGTGEIKLTELTNAYATFAAEGKRPTPIMIHEVIDREGNKDMAYKPYSEQVISNATAFLISSILSDNKTRSEIFGNTLTISQQAAVKTGTAEDYKDALTLGYNPDTVVGVWVGNNDNSAMDSVAGSLGAAPIWKALMEYRLKQTGSKQFKPPATIVKKSVCDSFSSTEDSEYFIQGTEPNIDCRWIAPLPQESINEPERVYTNYDVSQWKTWKESNSQIQTRAKKDELEIENEQPTPEPKPILTPATTPPPNT